MGNKIQKYQPLNNSRTNQGWKVDPLIVTTVGARGTTHTPSMKQPKKMFKLPETSIKYTFKINKEHCYSSCKFNPTLLKKNRK